MSTLADVDDIGVLKHFFHRFAVNLHDIPHPLVAGNVVKDSPVFVVVRILIAYLVDSNFGLLLFETENGSRAILGMDAIKITIFDIVEDYIREIQLMARFHNPKMDCDCRVEARI